jgi:hypothetical protein
VNIPSVQEDALVGSGVVLENGEAGAGLGGVGQLLRMRVAPQLEQNRLAADDLGDGTRYRAHIHQLGFGQGHVHVEAIHRVGGYGCQVGRHAVASDLNPEAVIGDGE